MKYRSYYKNQTGMVQEFDAYNDETALMISKSIEPYPDKVVRVDGDKEVEIKPLG